MIFSLILSVIRSLDWTVVGTPIQFCVSCLLQPINYYNPFIFSVFLFIFPKYTWRRRTVEACKHYSGSKPSACKLDQHRWKSLADAPFTTDDDNIYLSLCSTITYSWALSSILKTCIKCN